MSRAKYWKIISDAAPFVAFGLLFGIVLPYQLYPIYLADVQNFNEAHQKFLERRATEVESTDKDTDIAGSSPGGFIVDAFKKVV